MSSLAWRRIWQRRRRPDLVAPDGCFALGSRRCEPLGVSAKAASLDRATAAGLAVPSGFVVSHGTSAEGAVAVPRQMRAALGAGSHNTVPERSWAVRSAFGAEDGDSSSLAGWFTSVLNVGTRELGDAVAEVRASANVTNGLADGLVSGETEGERVLIPRLETVADGWRARLRSLLADVRNEFGDEAWDIEWADDGDTCWLVQIRPITHPTVRNETLTAANHTEILPRLPSQLMTSIVAEAGPNLFDWYRERVPGLPAERDFLHVVAGRPMINLSLLEDMMRHLGLPTALVAASIGGGHRNEQPMAPARVIRRSPSLVRLGLAQVTAVVRSASNRREASAIGSPAATTFTGAVDDLHRSYVALVTGMFPLSSAIGPPVAALRSAGTLLEHASRHRTVTTELADRRRGLRRQRGSRRDDVLHRFLADFGHRGVYESDIARPRYRNDPTSLTDPTPSLPPTSTSPPTPTTDASPTAPPRTLKGFLTLPIWWTAAKPMAARELLRHDAMRSFANIRDALVDLAAVAVDEGRLPTVDALWLLDADEVRRLDTAWVPDENFWAARRARRAELDAIDVPHVVQRFDDPADWHHDGGDGDGNSPDVLRGLALTTGRVTGQAWVLDEPSSQLPDGFDAATTILIARSIDAGWVSTIADVAAVVVEIGGDLSHGSILIRELGLPAITNVSGATRRLATGDDLTVDAGAGTVRRT